TATNDGGAGMLAALGATAEGAVLDSGPVALGGLTEVDLAPPRARSAGTELVLASDVDVPLLGLLGATKTFGGQKGLSDEELLLVDGRLRELADRCDRKLADAKGAGAAGGIGYA